MPTMLPHYKLIERALTHSGLTRYADLARKLDMTPTELYRIRKAEVTPSEAQIRRMAEMCGDTPDVWLARFRRHMKKAP